MKLARLVRDVVAALAAGFLWLAIGTGMASAAPVAPAEAVPSANIECGEGLCTLRLDLGATAPDWLPDAGLWLNVLEENLHALPDGAGFEVSDDIVLEMPVGNIQLTGAQLRLEMGEDNRVESFEGVAEVPMPSLPLLGSLTQRKAAEARIGFDRGDALSLADAPVDPERKYLYFDLASGASLRAATAGQTGELSLDIPEGQRALVVLDPLERFAYIDGHVTLRYNGELVFLTQLLDPTETLDLFAGELPLRHRATVQVSGVMSDALDEAQMELAGRYAVDAGRLGEWLKLEGQPLALEGSLALTPAGLLGTGVVRSSVAPERLLDSAVQAQVFVPFSGEYQTAYVELRTNLDIPIASFHTDAMARLDGALDVVADANVQMPQLGLEDALANAGSSGARLWNRSMSAVTEPARAGYGKLSELATGGVAGAAAGLEWSSELAAQQWCGWMGRCEAVAPVETAMR